jgi:hypothetical protein
MRSTAITFAILSIGAIAGEARGQPMTDDEILKLVYDRGYGTPKGFFRDPLVADGSHSLYFHQPGWFADDKAAAKKIVEDFLAKPSNIAVRKIEEEKETNRSFDFRGGRIWYRIHKPAWFTWAGKNVANTSFGVPLGGKPVELGALKAQPLTADAVREFAEYDWFVHNYNMAGAKVLKSSTRVEVGFIVHTLLTTTVTYGDFGLQDEIRVIEIRYVAAKEDGKVTLTKTLHRELKGKRN